MFVLFPFGAASGVSCHAGMAETKKDMNYYAMLSSGAMRKAVKTPMNAVFLSKISDMAGVHDVVKTMSILPDASDYLTDAHKEAMYSWTIEVESRRDELDGVIKDASFHLQSFVFEHVLKWKLMEDVFQAYSRAQKLQLNAKKEKEWQERAEKTRVVDELLDELEEAVRKDDDLAVTTIKNRMRAMLMM